MTFYKEHACPPRRKARKEGRQLADTAGNFLRSRKKLPAIFSLFPHSVLSVHSLAELGQASEVAERVRNKSGFTLIELLVVTVLMAIIISISVPAFIGLGRGAGMRGAVRSVHSTLSLLRQWAITHREQVTFVYTNLSAFSCFYAVNERGEEIISTNYNDPNSGSPRLSGEVMFEPSGNITFKTDGGLTSGSATEHICIQDRKFPGDTSKQKTISVNGLTGGIKVQ